MPAAPKKKPNMLQRLKRRAQARVLKRLRRMGSRLMDLRTIHEAEKLLIDAAIQRSVRVTRPTDPEFANPSGTTLRMKIAGEDIESESKRTIHQLARQEKKFDRGLRLLSWMGYQKKIKGTRKIPHPTKKK